MGSILIGNLCSLLGMAADTLSASRKTARGVLLVQIIGQACYGMSSLVLKGYSAVVQNCVSILRNLLAMRGRSIPGIEWLLVALGVGLGIVFNNQGVIGWLPIIANLEYSVAVFRFKDNEYALKAAFAVCVALFAVFNLAILNIVGAASNAVVLLTTLAFLLKTRKAR